MPGWATRVCADLCNKKTCEKKGTQFFGKVNLDRRSSRGCADFCMLPLFKSLATLPSQLSVGNVRGCDAALRPAADDPSPTPRSRPTAARNPFLGPLCASRRRIRPVFLLRSPLPEPSHGDHRQAGVRAAQRDPRLVLYCTENRDSAWYGDNATRSVVTTRWRAARLKKDDAASQRNLKPFFDYPCQCSISPPRLPIQKLRELFAHFSFFSFDDTAQYAPHNVCCALKNTLTHFPSLPICLALPIIPTARAFCPP